MFWSSVWQHVVSQPGGGPCRHHLRSAWRPSVAEPDGTPGLVCGQLTAGWRPHIWRCVESLPERRPCRSRTGLAVSGYIVVLVVIRHCRDLVIILPVIYLPASCNNITKWKLENKEGWNQFNKKIKEENNQSELSKQDYADTERIIIKTMEETVGRQKTRVDKPPIPKSDEIKTAKKSQENCENRIPRGLPQWNTTGKRKN